MKLSALILTKNEEKMIEGALSQLDFVDEIIVLDQHSQDNTRTFAKKYTEKIYLTNFEHFDKNRNLLAQKAKGDWLIYVDADERISKESKEEIIEAISKAEFSAYYFPRKNFILKKPVKHGGFWPDYVPRLFKRDKLVKWQGKVHESPTVNGNFGYLKVPLIHDTARDLSMMLKKSAKWARIEAELYSKNTDSRATILKLIYFSASQFLYRYFYKLGFLDGKVGLISSIYQGLHNAMIFTYLWEIQNDTEGKFHRISGPST